MPYRDLVGSRAIVTGASSGIGRSLALELARQGAVLVVTARRAERLEELAAQIRVSGGAVHPVAGDIADPELRRRVIDTARSALGGLDLLVNNAGQGAVGRFDRASPERLRRIMEVNFFAVAELTRLALPLLKQGRRPMVVNVGSILGHVGVPRRAEYCASKFALQGLSESLRLELASDGIDVLVVSPGTTRTEFFASATDGDTEPDWPRHAATSPEAVARQTVRAIRAGRREIIPSFWGRLLCALKRLSPALTERILRRYA
jgi:short-subunit dehydrogenase